MASANVSIFTLVAVSLMTASICLAYGSAKTFRRSQSDSSIRYGRGCKNDYDFDYMRLALQWSPGLCEAGPEHCYRRVNFFTIHGLWLNRYHGENPQDCCFQDHFDSNDLKSIKEDLDKFWISLYGPSEGDNEKFWSHEWLKHGTCAKNVPVLQGELAFFKKTLELYKSLNLDKVLRDAGIVPSNSTQYRGSEMIEAMSSVVGGKEANIGCMMSHSMQTVPLLTTISVCFDKNIQFIDCPNFGSGHCKDKLIFPSS